MLPVGAAAALTDEAANLFNGRPLLIVGTDMYDLSRRPFVISFEPQLGEGRGILFVTELLLGRFDVFVSDVGRLNNH
jgi:hypothetical protein